MERDPSLRSGSQGTANMVSATPLQPLIATASSSQEDMMGTLIQTIRQESQKVLPQTTQYSPSSRSSSTDGRSVRFNSPGPNRQSADSNQNQNIEIQTIIATDTTILIKPTDTTAVAISKTTDITIIAIQQISNKTEITQINNHADIITEQIINLGVVKHVLIAEKWDICLAKVEHRDIIKTIGSKIRKLTKIHEITIKTATQIPPSNKIL